MPDFFRPAIKAVRPNCIEYLERPMIAPSGFREYDARWRFPEEINLVGFQALGLALGTQIHAMGVAPRIVVGCDYRAYSLGLRQALSLGLMASGMTVLDIGVALSPTAYFAQFALDAPGVAMVTASHNPNGWTGVKIGAAPPLTFGPDEMAGLRQIAMQGKGRFREGGAYDTPQGMRERYIADVTGGFRLSRRLRIVCATGNGTAGHFAPESLSRIGAEVIPLHTKLDYAFPHHNPNPEALEMLHAMRDAVRRARADLALGFDGDGDRCGVVDDSGREIFADKIGVMLARDMAQMHGGGLFVADVKSTALFATDPLLGALGARVDYWKTGHSHMKRRVRALGALAGFEKSGHYFFAPPAGRGYDDGIAAAIALCRLLDAHPGKSLSALYDELPPTWITPTMSPHCADGVKYAVAGRIHTRLRAMQARGERLAGQAITGILSINGARICLQGGGWALVRPSSNTPNLVVVCESPNSEAEMRAIFHAIDAIIREHPDVGAYDQTI